MSSHGNRAKQHKRRRERAKNLPTYQKQKVELIDGNFSHYPRSFCTYHGAYLTDGLIKTHRCIERHCARLKSIDCGDGEQLEGGDAL